MCPLLSPVMCKFGTMPKDSIHLYSATPKELPPRNRRHNPAQRLSQHHRNNYNGLFVLCAPVSPTLPPHPTSPPPYHTPQHIPPAQLPNKSRRRMVSITVTRTPSLFQYRDTVVILRTKLSVRVHTVVGASKHCIQLPHCN